ncbi:MAG: DUF881 domain-containing protein, partial [Cellulomonadaceae bacterium]
GARTRSEGRSMQPAPRPDASMVLLDEVMRQPLDPGYAAAAARRSAGEDQPLTAWRRGVVLAVAIALGVMTAAATTALRAPQPDAVAARTLLENEVVAGRDRVGALTADISAVAGDLERLQADALSDTFPQLLRQTERDAVSAGTVAVTGPGIIVELRDAPAAAEDATDLRLRVQDYDVQVVVNALWASGAEAISVNGQRLTATSAIRSAGGAILVDLVGLSGPYEITAIGDPTTLATYFARTQAQQHLMVLSSRYGIAFALSSVDEVHLAAGHSATLFVAQTPDIGSSPAAPAEEQSGPVPSEEDR